MPSPSRLYLVGPRNPAEGAQPMNDFLDALQGIESAEHVSGEVGRFLVVRLSDAAFEDLNLRFGGLLIIEPNSPLTL